MDDVYVDNDDSSDLYVIETFGSPIPQQPEAHPGDPSTLLVKNCTLFSLAVALLELTYGGLLSTLQTQDDLNDSFTTYRIAERLTKRLRHEELPRFASVVAKCMYPTPESDCDFSFDNDAFRRRFYQDVVLPLKQDRDELLRE